ncbi:MAG: ABC transporter permease subunit [Spirochaetaceae bacterium]|jgi:putative aldouronate transport system permease protein|nr:ABC transporter permease subunit [Spirochaetaceae bacterium]
MKTISIKSSQTILDLIKKSSPLYIMALPAVALFFCFAYMPLFGLVIAFKRYTFDGGIFGSPWADPWYRNFMILFGNPAAFNAMKNTLLLNALFISVGTVFALVLALSFNEIRSRSYKRLTQSVTFLPFFISTVVVGVLVSGVLSTETGSLNGIIARLGRDRINFYMQPSYWPVIMLVVNIWKGAGYTAIVYLAAISGIDPVYYEAAELDGANRMQQVWYITLPHLRPTVIILTILAVGKIMNADFGLFFNVTRDIPTLYPTVDVIDTYIYRALRKMGDIGMSSAVGFFQSVVSFVLVLATNKLANKIEEGTGLF